MRLYPYALITVIVSAIIMALYYGIFEELIFGNHYSVLGIITSFLMVNQGWIFEYAPALNNPIWYICVLLIDVPISEFTTKKMRRYLI